MLPPIECVINTKGVNEMAKRELNDIEAVKQLQIYVRVSPEEKALMELKKDKYGYMFMSDYIRDACIYENIVEINISCNVEEQVQQFNDEIRQLTKEVRRILKHNVTMTDEEKNTVQNALYRTYRLQKKLISLINDKLDIKSIKRTAKERIYQEEVNNLLKEVEGVDSNDK